MAFWGPYEIIPSEPFLVIISFLSKYSQTFEHGRRSHWRQCVYIATWSYNQAMIFTVYQTQVLSEDDMRGNGYKRPLWMNYHARESVKILYALPPLCFWRPRTAAYIYNLRCGRTCDYKWQPETDKQSRWDDLFPPLISSRWNICSDRLGTKETVVFDGYDKTRIEKHR